MKSKSLILFLIAALLYASCAKIGSVSGGDKDTIPPVMVKSIPPDFATHFNAKKIRISFDEFIDLKDLPNNFMVSPPLSKLPEVRVYNKDLVIQPLDSLQPNTTYTLNFGNAVVDYTVGNAIPNFEFVFSTGSYVDSLSLQGRLLNSFDLTPYKEPVLVMLFSNLADSAPYLGKPAYVCRTDKNGWFVLNNLREGNYRLFALKDANSNMKFDMPSESIAFADSIIHLKATEVKDYIAEADTSNKKTRTEIKKSTPGKSLHAADTARTDTLKAPPHKRYGTYQSLFMFTEENLKQYLKESKRISPEKLLIVMNRPLRPTDSVMLKPINFSPSGKWLLPEYHPDRDTFEYWITDTALVHQDVLKVALSYEVTDSAGNYVVRLDTVDYRFAGKSTAKKKKDEKPKANRLILTLSTGSGKPLDLNTNMILTTDKPVASMDPAYIQLEKTVDTLKIPLKFSIRKDSFELRKFILTAHWEENTDYRFVVYPPAFTSIYETQPDTLKKTFKTQKADYYGRLMVTLDSVQNNVIVQLLQKDIPVRQESTRKSGKLTFDFVPPGKYKVKIIYDRNNNGFWDTGRYLEKLQPEKVGFYHDEIEIRSNWDLDITLPGKEPADL